ncbi:NXPE family member 3-like protein [Labeo rohita]|uniref:NXPE family member 3-like protein n=1 Tax=Labeo rohita TaxID=84645 RepID=A0A498LF45_LABRO|nr:NXPE family member 3-like protein [Labeo rohita]
MNLHVQYQSGPLIAVDVENNIDLHWRAHCVPLRTLKSAVADLHYISNEIDDQAGGPHTVFIFNLGPHFTTYPLDFYTHRVLRIRKAVLALLQRAPDTTVIIKTVNTGYKASVFGEVVDLLNGSYSVRFLLPWVGEAQVAVRLIHSSEAVQVLKRHRDTDSDRVYFNGYYEGPGANKIRLRETVTCNVKWDKNGLERMGTGDCCCEYNDPRTQETWRCKRPNSLPCSALVYHSMGGYRNHLTSEEKMLMRQTNKGINGDESIIKIVHSHGNQITDLKQMNLYVQYQSGPLIAVDVENNIDLHWRAHGVPLRTLKTAVANLHYISNEIDDQAGGPHTVFIFNLGPHFTTYPLDFYTRRVLRIRKSVLELLQRAPDTTVIIKTVNTGYKAGGPNTVFKFNLGPHFTTYPLDFYTHRVLRIRKAVLALLQRAPDTTVIIKAVNTGCKEEEFNNTSARKCEELNTCLGSSHVSTYLKNQWICLGELWSNFGQSFYHHNSETNNKAERFFLTMKYQFLKGKMNSRIDHLLCLLCGDVQKYYR